MASTNNAISSLDDEVAANEKNVELGWLLTAREGLVLVSDRFKLNTKLVLMHSLTTCKYK